MMTVLKPTLSLREKWAQEAPDEAARSLVSKFVTGPNEPVVKLEVECDLESADGRKAALSAVLNACMDIEAQIMDAHIAASKRALVE